MHSRTVLQLHRLLNKEFIQQLFAHTCGLYQSVYFEIRDCQGNLLLAYPNLNIETTPLSQSPIMVENQSVGTLSIKTMLHSQAPPLPATNTLAQFWGMLLSHMAQLQWERRCVAQDSLNRYRELALLHQLGEKMGSCLDSNKLADIILSEVRKFTKASAGSLLLYCLSTGTLKAVASFGSKEISPALTTATYKLAEIVFASGKAEIIDAASNDPRLAAVAVGTEPLLCVPLKIESRVLGVLNLNYKAGNDSFSSEDVKLTEVIAAHAANAFETARLFKELENMAYAIILSASATIDERDDCTASHSTRVADISLAIARTLNKLHANNTCAGNNPQPLIKLQEIEYAALLHDIGKIGVPEAILNKRSRLSPDRILAIKARFDFITATTGQNLSSEIALIIQLNEAHAILPSQCQEINALTHRHYTDLEGNSLPFVWPEEQAALCVPRGNLVKQEFEQIQSHAEKSYKILKKIPFPGSLGRIPAIAYQHHERLNGCGYPNGLTDDEILLEAKIVSVADVFEALTATDRPYRSPVSTTEALEILRSEAEAGYLDLQPINALAYILHTDKQWFTSLTSIPGRKQ